MLNSRKTTKSCGRNWSNRKKTKAKKKLEKNKLCSIKKGKELISIEKKRSRRIHGTSALGRDSDLEVAVATPRASSSMEKMCQFGSCRALFTWWQSFVFTSCEMGSPGADPSVRRWKVPTLAVAGHRHRTAKVKVTCRCIKWIPIVLRSYSDGIGWLGLLIPIHPHKTMPYLIDLEANTEQRPQQQPAILYSFFLFPSCLLLLLLIAASCPCKGREAHFYRYMRLLS